MDFLKEHFTKHNSTSYLPFKSREILKNFYFFYKFL
jgi:hypothetical protein